MSCTEVAETFGSHLRSEHCFISAITYIKNTHKQITVNILLYFVNLKMDKIKNDRFTIYRYF